MLTPLASTGGGPGGPGPPLAKMGGGSIIVGPPPKSEPIKIFFLLYTQFLLLFLKKISARSARQQYPGPHPLEFFSVDAYGKNLSIL